MLRWYHVLLVCVLFISVNAQNMERTGGYARVVSMGNNPYLVDPEGIKLNPAWASVYHDFLWGDLGSNSGPTFGNSSAGQFAGLNVSITDQVVVGALLTRNDFNSFSIGTLDPGNLVNQLNNTNINPQAVPLNNNLELLAAFKLGMLTLGAGVAYAATSSENTPAGGQTTTASASQFGVNVGVLVNFTKRMMLDAGVSFMMPSASFEPPQGNSTELSQTIIGVAARFFLPLSQKIRFVPTALFVTASGTRDAGGTSTDLPSATVIGAGFGIEYSTGDFLLVGGPAFSSASSTNSAVPNVSPEFSTSALVFPIWNLGAEWMALDWLVARLGYTAATGNATFETPAAVTTINERSNTIYSPLGATVGIGLRFGDFSFDATVNTDVLRQGLNNIGGGGPTFAYISSSYAF